MTMGIRVRNPDTGQVVLDLNDKLTTRLGQRSTGTSNGSITMPVAGEPFFIVMNAPTPGQSSYVYPRLSVSGSRISWTFTGDGTKVSLSFIYGVVV